MLRQCIDAGYTSVMLDYSLRPFEENVKALEDVVRIARPRGITVEGEIGRVGKADESSVEANAISTLTDPADAVEYARVPGWISWLCPSATSTVSTRVSRSSISNCSRRSTGRCRSRSCCTGVPASRRENIQRSIGLGIVKVNVASELVHGLRGSLTAQWARGMNLWSPLAVAEARKIMEPVVEKWIRITGAAGKA